MEYVIKNKELSAIIDSFGAQLKSLKDNENGTEYLWSASPKYWGKTSPVLFPFIGVLKNNSFQYKGKNYAMTRHGFARDMEFELREQGEDYLILGLKATEKTLESYPFLFDFELEHRLENKRLKVLWHIKNEGENTMYFSVGGHPAFACPPGEEGKRTDCFVKFEEKDEIVVTEIDMEKGLVTGQKHSMSLEQGILPISEDLFAHDALVLENHQCHAVELCDQKKQPYIRVEFDAPLVGVWSVADSSASYVCIEPWYGRCDSVDFEGEIKERDWTNELEPGEVFEEGYVISGLN